VAAHDRLAAPRRGGRRSRHAGAHRASPRPAQDAGGQLRDAAPERHGQEAAQRRRPDRPPPAAHPRGCPAGDRPRRLSGVY